ncbi:hypothetical protein AXF42_Ash018450 [Apostasia shenzhenica]|uniref:Uncharacterized protein n=1 Tax=Apostasia shenzhenica TaxID=1088818 RepID=A0A2I0BEC3_9ASPA|nr:hypothetical protein AXF42_Ash018450 [Apostasia shenzhenica]
MKRRRARGRFRIPQTPQLPVPETQISRFSLSRALSLSMALWVSPDGLGGEWEVCNDNGFIYKRRRRRRHHPSPSEPPPNDTESERRRQQRERKMQCLLTIRDKYQREIEQWESLSAALLRLANPPAAATGVGTSCATPFPLAPRDLPQLDDFLAQMDAQEAALRKLSDFCDCVDSLCEAQEERLTQMLIDLPVWGSPRALIRSLCN